MRSAGILLLLLGVTAGVVTAQGIENVQLNQVMDEPEEMSISINPTNPDNIVGVGQVPCHYYYTFDGGETWGEDFITDPLAFCDPTVCFGPDGHAYYAYIGYFNHSGIFVNRSDDGGMTFWPQATIVVDHTSGSTFDDKEYPVADYTDGPTRGNIYIAWTRFSEYGSYDTSDSSWIYFSHSTDQAMSFSEPIKICDVGGNARDGDDTVEGAVPAVGPNGEVYVAWAGPRGIEFDRSLDAGVTFGTDRVITEQPGGWVYNVPGINRCNGLPITEADISDSPYRGRVYVNWTDQRNGDTDVFLIYSDDGGDTWGPVIRVNDDPIYNGAHQFLTWMDVDPVTGTVCIAFYDRRHYNPSFVETDVYIAVSDDGGDTFMNLRVSESPFHPSSSVFFGDYIGISAYGGRVRPIWMRLDGGQLTSWTALLDLPTTSVPAAGDILAKLEVVPNPLRAGVRIRGLSAMGAVSRVAIHDIQGRLVRTVGRGDAAYATEWLRWDARDGHGLRVAPGVYFVSARGFDTARLVVLR